MKCSSFAAVLMLALVDVASAQAQNPTADTAKMASPEKTAGTALSADRQLPSSSDPRVCLEFPTAAQVIACAEKYRPRKRQA